MTETTDGYVEHYRDGSVALAELNEGSGHWFVVIEPGQYRVSISACRDRKTLSVGIDVEWSKERLGVLARYTPSYENTSHDCSPGEVTISDDGLLSVMALQSTANIVLHIGWSAQLPREAVGPIRRAIAMAEAEIKESNKGDVAL